MHNTMKVVRWEVKRNLKSKSFVYGLFLTPAIFALFLFLPSLLNKENNGLNLLTIPSTVLEQTVPGIFAGIILLSIIYTGMMTFQSASQERKDKMAEIILSSLTPTELMQGKIFGYFALGLIQVFVWIGLAIPFILWKVDQTILSYLFTYETVVFLIFAVLGYLFYAALFVSLGATIEDVSASGNFQGMVFMLPFIPVVFISSILEDPNSTLVKVISYIPFTSPSVMIFRLTLLENWVWWELGLAILMLLFSIFAFMKLAGKIFKVGIQKYGKNATVRDILSWIKSS